MTKKAASDLQCPVCGQQAEGRRAAKRVKKWAADSRLDRFMFDRLMTLIKAKMYSGEGAVEEEDKLRQGLKQQLWGDKPPPAPGFKEKKADKLEQGFHPLMMSQAATEAMLKGAAGQPVEMSPKAQKLRAKALKQRRQLKPDGEADADADWALNYAEKKNEKLAKDRAYNRDYYHKNKQRIERLRKARLERRTSARSPNTGAKTNGH